MIRAGQILLLLLLLSSCKLRGDVDRQSFVILVESQSNDFRPVEGLTVLGAGGVEIGRTNADGRALFIVNGQEGESAEFTVQPPPGMLLAEGNDKRRVLLKRLRSISGAYSSINVVDHSVKLRKRKLPYVVLLATNHFAGLPVVVFGVEKTRLNSKGVGMFLHEGLPGDEITVTLLTESNPRILPVSPSKTFVLPDQPTQLLWRTALDLRKQAEVKKTIRKGPARHGPIEIK